MSQANMEVREAKGNIPYWRIAEKMGVTEYTLVRWMRTELLKSKRERILAAIAEIKAETKDE